MKLSAILEAMEPKTLHDYAKLCGWTLAGAHALSGDAAMTSEKIG